MSYSFNVTAKDGVINVPAEQQPNAHIPDGTFSVAGHEDADWLSVSVTRKDETGRQIAQASGYGAKS